MCSGQMTTSPSSRAPGGPGVVLVDREGEDVGRALDLAAVGELSSAIRSASTNSTARWPSSMPADASAIATSPLQRLLGQRELPITSTSSNARRSAGA